MGAQEVQEVVQALGNEYKGTAYHLLERNCNHFSNELCLKLTGNPAPSWVSIINPSYQHSCLAQHIQAPIRASSVHGQDMLLHRLHGETQECYTAA
jgi:hypothetical protein